MHAVQNTDAVFLLSSHKYLLSCSLPNGPIQYLANCIEMFTDIECQLTHMILHIFDASHIWVTLQLDCWGSWPVCTRFSLPPKAIGTAASKSSCVSSTAALCVLFIYFISSCMCTTKQLHAPKQCMHTLLCSSIAECCHCLSAICNSVAISADFLEETENSTVSEIVHDCQSSVIMWPWSF